MGACMLIPVAILLAGCANQQSPDPQAKEDKAAASEVAKETGAIDDTRCQSYGFQPGSPSYVQCRKEIASEHQQIGINE
jgi:hypothetical protein